MPDGAANFRNVTLANAAQLIAPALAHRRRVRPQFYSKILFRAWKPPPPRSNVMSGDESLLAALQFRLLRERLRIGHTLCDQFLQLGSTGDE
jgi:hypothetical protein